MSKIWVRWSANQSNEIGSKFGWCVWLEENDFWEEFEFSNRAQKFSKGRHRHLTKVEIESELCRIAAIEEKLLIGDDYKIICVAILFYSYVFVCKDFHNNNYIEKKIKLLFRLQDNSQINSVNSLKYIHWLSL
jgi:hypothetical protein